MRKQKPWMIAVKSTALKMKKNQCDYAKTTTDLKGFRPTADK